MIVADHQGNLFYLYAVIRPDGPYDWASPVDSSTAATEWEGIMALGDPPAPDRR